MDNVTVLIAAIASLTSIFVGLSTLAYNFLRIRRQLDSLHAHLDTQDDHLTKQDNHLAYQDHQLDKVADQAIGAPMGVTVVNEPYRPGKVL